KTTARDRRPSSGLCDLKVRAKAQSAGWVVVSAESSSFDFPDYGFAATNTHSFAHYDFNLMRHKQICSRAELNHAKTFPAFYSFTAPLPTNNSPGQDSGDLRAFDGEIIALNYQRILLVQQPRVFARGHHEFARFV